MDSELMHHKMDSIFYNDLFALDVEKRKWFPLKARKGKSGMKQQTDQNKISVERASEEKDAPEADNDNVDDGENGEGEDDEDDMSEA